MLHLADGQRLEIVKASVEPPGPRWPPGAVCEVTRDGFVVVCGGPGRLRAREVQPAGERAMPARDFLNGARLRVGTVLGA